MGNGTNTFLCTFIWYHRPVQSDKNDDDKAKDDFREAFEANPGKDM